MRVPLIAAGTMLAGLTGTAHAALLPLFGHYETVTNNTGTAANDITLKLPHAAQVAPGKGTVSIAAPAFAGGTATGAGTTTVTITGPAGSSVAGNGGSTTVGWFSAIASDILDTESFWTNNGANIGAITLPPSNPLSFNLNENGDGTVTVSVDNESGVATAYSALTIDNGAPIADFSADVDYADMGLGTSVTTLIPSSGILPLGITDVATFTPSDFGYEGESVSLDGAVIFLGEAEDSAIPEPATTLQLGLVGLLGCALCRWPGLRRSARGMRRWLPSRSIWSGRRAMAASDIG